MPTEESNKVTQEVTNKGTMIDSCNTVINRNTYNISIETVAESSTSPEKDIPSRPSEDDLDRQTLELLLSHFSTNVMDAYFDNGPEYIAIEVSAIADSWHSIINAGSFCIYNQALLDVIMAFYKPFRDLIMSSAKHYFLSNNPSYVHYEGLEWDDFVDSKAAKTFYGIVNSMQSLQPKYQQMLSFIKQNYTIDIRRFSEKFEKEQESRKMRMKGETI